MKFNVTKIAAAVAAGVGVSVAGINAANADQLLFPYLAASPTVTTLVSVVNTESSEAVNRLHYHYYYKNGANLANDAACGEVDFLQNTSPYDLVTFDVSGVYGLQPLGVMFEDNAAGKNARYSESPTNVFTGLRGLGTSRAFLLVDNNTAGFVGENLQGEVFVMEFRNGAVWGYQAYNAAPIVGSDGVTPSQLNLYEFSDRVETTGEVLANVPGAPLPETAVLTSIMPFNEVQTRFFVTPIATTANEQFGPELGSFGPFQFRNNLWARVALSINDPSLNTLGVMYDRDENPVSGRVVQTVRCVGGVDARTLLDPAALSRLPNGGWAYFRVVSPQAGSSLTIGADPLAPLRTNQVVSFKLEFNDAASPTIDGQAVGGIYNNAFWMKKGHRESQSRYPYVLTHNGGTVTGNALPIFNFDVVQHIGTYTVSHPILNSPYPIIDTTAVDPAYQLPSGLPLDNVPVTSIEQQ